MTEALMDPSINGIAITRMIESHGCFKSDGNPTLNNCP